MTAPLVFKYFPIYIYYLVEKRMVGGYFVFDQETILRRDGQSDVPKRQQNKIEFLLRNRLT
ncbi:hypothetical protein AN964_20025 [Heyndrickxia shackletonii]|uniref:Uncharacterized protein n=1 Tax=Heyndrickxia shackletonii TaxID=157838 RepID=A0A0Q3TAV2_9BACI|nr:hypothetical protein [Heyndrickxia shackletonii]KQL51280.1 hypothetical protein AN964_20025 [Heyndrickxia shackletonii]NEY98446.1 hypothetical protein [Heyndrickxia shackletonii]